MPIPGSPKRLTASDAVYGVSYTSELHSTLLIARTMHDRGIPDLGQINAGLDAILAAFKRRDEEAVVAAVVRHIEDGATGPLPPNVRHTRQATTTAFGVDQGRRTAGSRAA